jgi:DNA (cytosine-5)-methyltransferase 1
MSKPLLLDLFCGAGGASMGYYHAGFDVVGVDIKPMPRYPFAFIKSDALEFLDYFLAQRQEHGESALLDKVVAIHASPPCQQWSVMSRCRPGLAATYPALIEPTCERLQALGLPYVIENVPKAPLNNPTVLCGSQFNLTSAWKGDRVGLRRHRGFEASFCLPDPGPCDHTYRFATVAGHGRRNVPYWSGKGYAQLARDLMGIQWMSRDELDEAIPPAYTRYVGGHLMAHLRDRAQLRLAA